MKLRIRSQDKTQLIEVEYLQLYETNNETLVMAIHGENMVRLGNYKSKERALEILDEIDEKITLINTLSLVHDNSSLIAFKKATEGDKIQGLCCSYQMPQDEE